MNKRGAVEREDDATASGAARGTASGSASGSPSGTAYGAVTILNATATGRGCALAIDARTTAHWTPQADGWAWHGTSDDKLARAVHEVVRRKGGARGAAVDCQTPFPPARGLKTSSAAATAMLRAATAAAGIELDADRLDALAVQAARDAGVTITGALDDQVAVSRGGCHLSDNQEGRVVQSFAVPAWHVAVWVPDKSIQKARVAGVDPGAAAEGARAAEALLRDGDVPGAMTRNGQAFHALYAAAGLPVTRAPVDVALAAGALGSGLSGTGPAVAAIFEAPAGLAPVAGGRWRWHKAVGG